VFEGQFAEVTQLFPVKNTFGTKFDKQAVQLVFVIEHVEQGLVQI
jgi:hypothetical protein